MRSNESVNCNELLLYNSYQLKFGTPNFLIFGSKKLSTKYDNIFFLVDAK